MKIFIGADHNGYRLKQSLVEYLKSQDYEVEDDGNNELNTEDDFPVFAARVVSSMKQTDDSDPRGILICGSGQGMAMAANRYKGIRAAVVWDSEEAKLSRNDDDANVLALPARLLENNKNNAFKIVDTWLQTPFEKIARRTRRIAEMDQLQ